MTAAAAFLGGVAAGAALCGLGGWLLWRRELARLGRLLSFAGHEINTPLTAVSMTALNFLSGIFGEIPPEQAKWLQMLRAQSSRMGSIVGELRDLIHHHMRRDLVVFVEEVSVPETVDAVLRAVGSSVCESGVHVKAELDGLPPVMADPDRFFRTVSSMFFHARKFRTVGDMRLQGRSLPGEVEIALEYTGAKLSPDDVDHSLDLFYPARRRKDQMLCCVGMGLGMLRVVARLQGGDFDFTAKADGRARLALRMPTTVKPPAKAARRP